MQGVYTVLEKSYQAREIILHEEMSRARSQGRIGMLSSELDNVCNKL